MKNLLFALFLFFAITLSLSAKSLDFTPLRYDYNGIINYKKHIIVYGSEAHIIIAHQDSLVWTERRVFDYGAIINVFDEVSQLVAVNEFGQFAKSTDEGRTWNLIAETKQSGIQTAIRGTSGYLLRNYQKVVLISLDFNNSYEYKIESSVLQADFFPMGYKQSMVSMNQDFVIIDDSSKVLILNEKAKLKQVIDLGKSIKGKSNPASNYWIEKDNDSYFIFIHDSVYITKDFIDYKAFTDYTFKVTNTKKYDIASNPNSIDYKIAVSEIKLDGTRKLISTASRKLLTQGSPIKDYLYLENKLYFIGRQKFLAWVKLGDSVLNVVSTRCNSISKSKTPDKVNDSTLLLYIKDDFKPKKASTVFTSYDNCLSYNETYDIQDKNISYLKKFQNTPFDILFYDKKSDKLIATSKNQDNSQMYDIYVSDNLGKDFTVHSISNYSSSIPYEDIEEPFYQYHNKELSILNTWSFNKKNFYRIITIDSNYKKKFLLLDTLQIPKYFSMSDTNNILFFTFNTLDSMYQFTISNRLTKQWHTIKNYQKNIEYLGHKVFSKSEQNSPVIFWLYDSTNSKISLELLDSNQKVSTLYEYKLQSLNSETEKFNLSFDYNNNKYYFTFADTFYIASNINNPDTWEKYLLPRNGRISKTLKAFDDKFFVRFASDSLADNIYWMKFVEKEDTIVVDKNPLIEASDADFGNQQISKTSFIMTNIVNNSEYDLEIYGYKLPTSEYFKTTVISADSTTPKIISPYSFIPIYTEFYPKDTIEYLDSIIIYSNSKTGKNVSFLKGKGIDTLTSSVTEIEEPYLYATLAYPLPTKNLVKAKIYWDSNYSLDEKNINIIDLFGNEIHNSKQIKFELINSYSAFINCDFSTIPIGIYFIQVKLGSSYKLIKILKE